MMYEGNNNKNPLKEITLNGERCTAAGRADLIGRLYFLLATGADSEPTSASRISGQDCCISFGEEDCFTALGS